MPSDRSDGWALLADGSRRAIVTQLADGELTVGELTARLPISQPAVSQHLKVLREAGLVDDRPDGTRRRYRLNEHGLAALRDQLDAFWRDALANLDRRTATPQPTDPEDDQ